MAKVMDQLSEITTVLQDVQSKYQALLQDTTSLKTSFSQLMEHLDFEPTSNLFANFATSVIYELREVDHGTITPLLPPSNISPTPIWTKKGHLQPRWDHSARAKINKEWADNFRSHFVHPDSQLAKQMGLSPKHRASLSLKEIENFHLQAFSNLQAKSGHRSTTKRKSSGPAVLQQDTNEHDLNYSEGEPESENVDIDYTLELKHHKRHSKGFQSDELSMEEEEKLGLNKPSDAPVYVVDQPAWQSQRFIHFKHVIADAVASEALEDEETTLPNHYWKNNWNYDESVLNKSANNNPVPEWTVSRGWIRENPDAATSVIKAPQSLEEIENLELLDRYLEAGI